jgi:hypothetical protein
VYQSSEVQRPSFPRPRLLSAPDLWWYQFVVHPYIVSRAVGVTAESCRTSRPPGLGAGLWRSRSALSLPSDTHLTFNLEKPSPMLARVLRVRSPQTSLAAASRRTSQIARHMTSASSQVSEEVRFQQPEEFLVNSISGFTPYRHQCYSNRMARFAPIS